MGLDFPIDLSQAVSTAALVTGDGLIVLHRSLNESHFTPEDACQAALMYRRFCTLHGCDRDEYQQQLGGGFSQTESVIAAYLGHPLVSETAVSDSASEAPSSAQNGPQKGKLNTNFFALHADDRAAADVVANTNGTSMVIETSERTIECGPFIAPASSHDAGSSYARLMFVVTST